MNSLVEFIDRHKGGILITVLLHFAVLIFVNFSTFNEKYEVETWSFKGRNIETDDIEISADQVETKQEMALYEQQEYLNAAKDLNNTKTEKDEEVYNLPSENFSADNAFNFENSIKEELKQKNDTGSDPIETSTNNGENSDSSTNNQNNNPNTTTTNPPNGKTMVAFDLINRTATRLRNPGYTCGNENGVVVVKIKVTQSGVVESAKYVPTKSQATNCMINKAEQYALNSKFNYSSVAPKLQEGEIIYTFIYKK